MKALSVYPPCSSTASRTARTWIIFRRWGTAHRQCHGVCKHCHQWSLNSIDVTWFRETWNIYATCQLIHWGYFYSAYSSPLLLRGAPTTACILCEIFTPKCHRQLRVKNLPIPKVLLWRLEWDSNLRPFGQKAANQPMSHYVPQLLMGIHWLVLHVCLAQPLLTLSTCIVFAPNGIQHQMSMHGEECSWVDDLEGRYINPL